VLGRKKRVASAELVRQIGGAPYGVPEKPKKYGNNEVDNKKKKKGRL